MSDQVMSDQVMQPSLEELLSQIEKLKKLMKI